MIELRQNKEELQQISDRAIKALMDRHEINLMGATNALPTIVYTFLVTAIEHLNANKSENEPYELNMFQLFDMGIAYNEEEDAEKEGNFVPYLRPGQEMKLLAKDDSLTEE